MNMDRTPWKAEFTMDGRLPWQCPFCSDARLVLARDSLKHGQTAESLRAQTEDAFEPEWTEGRFSCMFACPACEGQLAVAGAYRVQDDRYYDPVAGEAGDYQLYFRPQFFSDAIPIVTLPHGTPAPVADSLRISFGLYWSDPESAANRVRKAVEQLLTALRIPRTTGRGHAKKRSFLTLHQRIERLRAIEPDLADKLLAVKWLGNAGSHVANLHEDDVLDGYEILSYVLDELYQRRRDHVGRLSREINRRKGPRSQHRARGR